MSKKTKLAPELVKILESLPKEGQDYINGLSDEARHEQLTLMQLLAGSGTEVAKTSADIQDVSLRDDSDQDVNLIFGKTIFAGMSLHLEFLGTVHLMSSNFKENWPEVIIDGKTFYESRKFRFRDPKTGKIIHIFNAPMMGNVLRSLPTKTSPLTASKVHKDPAVLITYDGKVSKEEALEKYGFEFNSGKETHGVRVKVLDQGFPVERYAKGVINWVERPYNVRKAMEGDAAEFETARWDEATRIADANMLANQAHVTRDASQVQ